MSTVFLIIKSDIISVPKNYLHDTEEIFRENI